MLPGFNHNVKYRGRVFHCQTEDSGISNPHIITHLFVGGNILATKKTSYADIVKSDRLEEVVQELMQEQHKEILKKLLSGGFDPAIEERGANAAHLNGPAPLNVDAGAQNRVSMLAPSGPAPQPKQAAAAAAPAKVAARPAAEVSMPAPQMQPAQPKQPAPKPAAKAPAGVPPEIAMPQSLPQSAVVKPKPAEKPGAQSLPQEVIDARNLSVVPKMKEAPAETIFGEDLISEKSLDEVILSYLAQEADR